MVIGLFYKAIETPSQVGAERRQWAGADHDVKCLCRRAPGSRRKRQSERLQMASLCERRRKPSLHVRLLVVIVARQAACLCGASANNECCALINEVHWLCLNRPKCMNMSGSSATGPSADSMRIDDFMQELANEDLTQMDEDHLARSFAEEKPSLEGPKVRSKYKSTSEL